MNITFMGAAKCVTGSCTLLEIGGRKVLVDCGQRQGKDAGDTPMTQFAFEPDEIEAVLLTHAHIDHSGLIPLLVKKGFTGGVYCTEATAQLCSIMFPDAGHIQEMEAEWQNRKRRRAGRPEIEPLYTVEDARRAIRCLRPLEYEETKAVLPGVAARFVDAGHLLGSASIEIFTEEQGVKKKLVFSGDIGNQNKPIIKDPSYITEADIVFMESTYGDRLHRKYQDLREQLKDALSRALKRGGNVVIPSFAVGRTQEVLYSLSVMLEENSLPGLERVPVYIDSPLGIAATEIFRENQKGYYDEEAMEYRAEGVEFFSFDTLVVAQSMEESKAINMDERQKIIISSSGMCEAGRIKHHLKHNLWRPDATVLFVGYQAVGTLGRRILDGNKDVRIFGEDIQVKASVEFIEGFSGHADQAGLLKWIGHFPTGVERVFVMHGEEKVSELFARELIRLGYRAIVPDLFETFDADTFERTAAAERPMTVDMLSDLLARARRMIEARDEPQAAQMCRELEALISRWDGV